MKFFIDTADINEIKAALEIGIIDGVTTNPSLIAKTGKDFKTVVDEICAVVDGPISVEAISMDAEGLIKDARELSKINKTHSVIHTPYKTDSSLWAKHNQTSFLQLAFLDCGILVEGATDRLAYEHIFSDQKFLNNVEYKFISSGGKDSISNPEKIAQDLKVPYAVILDIDVLKEGEYKNIEKMLKLSGQNTILEKIKTIGAKLKGIQDFKKKGLESISDGTTKTEVEAIINDLAGLGVFVVPCGCLESWHEIKCLKPEFPEKFIKSYRKKKSDFKNVIDFLKQIETYLQSKIQ